MSRDTVLSKPGQKEQSVKLNLLEVVGQSFSIGPLVDVALFLAIVAATAGAVGPLAVLLASIGMVAFSLVVAFYASETGGAGAIGDYIERAWVAWRVQVLLVFISSLLSFQVQRDFQLLWVCWYPDFLYFILIGTVLGGWVL